ncbi:MAG: hypothetical protein U1C74_07685 [Phenylobacterium sp.]|nr:hypothetical protein [Phenylobacterium sp.]
MIVDDEETLLNYLPFDDEMGAADALDAPTSSTGPYVWAGAGGNELRWGYGTWS